MSEREFEIVVYGATSFVGQILCRYLAEEFHYPDTSWAMAGRSKSKLNQVRLSLGKPHAAIRCLIADAGDEDALREMCEQTRVVLSTVGPYALYGETLVKVCAETGTDYCDLTGEPQWIRGMIERYQATAHQTGARIVHCCGFDSIPSDLGTYFLQQVAMKQLGGYCQQVKMRVKGLKGGNVRFVTSNAANLASRHPPDRHFILWCVQGLNLHIMRAHTPARMEPIFINILSTWS